MVKLDITRITSRLNIQVHNIEFTIYQHERKQNKRVPFKDVF